MANILSNDKQAMLISALAEGNSIRSIERMSGVPPINSPLDAVRAWIVSQQEK